MIPRLWPLLAVAACSVPGVAVERSDTPPEDVFEVGTVAYLEDHGVYIVHHPDLGVVAFDDTIADDCRLLLVEGNRGRVFANECDSGQFHLDGTWLEGPSPYGLTPFPTYLGVDGHLYIEGEPRPRVDRHGNPIDDPGAYVTIGG